MDIITRLSLLGGIRSFGFSAIWPYVGLILYRVGVPLYLIGGFYAIQTVISVIGQLGGGVITDKLGRKKAMILGTIGGSVSLLLAYVFYNSFPLVLCILSQTMFNSIYSVANTTMVGDTRKGVSKLVLAYSRLRVGINAGWALGPFVGGALMSLVGYRFSFMFTAIITGISIPFIITLEESRARPTRINFHVGKNFALFLIPAAMLFMVMGLMGFGLTLYYNDVRGIPLYEVGTLFAVNGFMIVFLQEIIGRVFSTRVRLSLILGSILYFVSYSLVSLCYSFLLAILDMTVITCGEMIVSPVIQALAADMSEETNRGQYMGVFGFASSLGRNLGNIMISEVMNYYLKEGFLWPLAASPALISAIGFSVLTTNKRVHLS